MSSNYIDKFINASIDVISQITGILPEPGEKYEKDAPYISNNTLVLIGLTGQIQGNVIITFDEGAANNIASIMLGGVKVTTLDEMAKSAISELCNMILGATATDFCMNNIVIDITPPTVLSGDKIQVTPINKSVTCASLNFAGSKIELNLSYQG